MRRPASPRARRRAQWYPEIRHNNPDTPFILVGTKTDLREDPEVLEKLEKKRQAPVHTAEGQRLADELGAARFLECSAKTQQGLKAVFDAAISVALEHRKNKSKKPKKVKCTLL